MFTEPDLDLAAEPGNWQTSSGRGSTLDGMALAISDAPAMESPSITRLRAAVRLLDGITDETILDVTERDRAHLHEALRRIDAGEI